MNTGTTRQQLALTAAQLGQLTDTGPNRGMLAAHARFGSPEQKRAAHTRLSELSREAQARRDQARAEREAAWAPTGQAPAPPTPAA